MIVMKLRDTKLRTAPGTETLDQRLLGLFNWGIGGIRRHDAGVLECRAKPLQILMCLLKSY